MDLMTKCPKGEYLILKLNKGILLIGLIQLLHTSRNNVFNKLQHIKGCDWSLHVPHLSLCSFCSSFPPSFNPTHFQRPSTSLTTFMRALLAPLAPVFPFNALISYYWNILSTVSGLLCASIKQSIQQTRFVKNDWVTSIYA